MSIQRPITGFRFAEIQRSDTAQTIAARELDDAARWPELVGYNALVPPFITDDPAQAGPGVLLSGGLIRVPASVSAFSATLTPDEVFGRDIMLTNRRLSASSSGDFAIASGLDNLRQALQNRVTTDRGELMFHRPYGSLLRRLLGTINGPTASLLAAQYAKAAVLADPRVSSVSSSTATVVGDSVTVRMVIVPVNGKPIDVTVTA